MRGQRGLRSSSSRLRLDPECRDPPSGRVSDVTDRDDAKIALATRSLRSVIWKISEPCDHMREEERGGGRRTEKPRSDGGPPSKVGTSVSGFIHGRGWMDIRDSFEAHYSSPVAT